MYINIIGKVFSYSAECSNTSMLYSIWDWHNFIIRILICFSSLYKRWACSHVNIKIHTKKPKLDWKRRRYTASLVYQKGNKATIRKQHYYFRIYEEHFSNLRVGLTKIWLGTEVSGFLRGYDVFDISAPC